MTTYGIGEMAAEFGLTLRTLRFYQDRGLINPQRVGTTRIYSEADRERIREVTALTKLGFTLSEILAGHFPPEKFAEQLVLVRQQRADLDETIAVLEQRVAA